MREQKGAPMRRLREPMQNTIAIRSTVLPSEGLPHFSLRRAAGVEEPFELGPVTTFG